MHHEVTRNEKFSCSSEKFNHEIKVSNSNFIGTLIEQVTFSSLSYFDVWFDLLLVLCDLFLQIIHSARAIYISVGDKGSITCRCN